MSKLIATLQSYLIELQCYHVWTPTERRIYNNNIVELKICTKCGAIRKIRN